MNNLIKIFRPNYRSFLTPSFWAILIFTIVILAFSVGAQIMDGSFPDYWESIEIVLVFGGMYIAFALFLFVLPLFLTVKVYHNGIKGYDHLGKFYFIYWHEILNVFRKEIEGHPYIVVRTKKQKKLITIPFILGDMEDFASLVSSKDTSGHFHLYFEENPIEN